MDVLGEEKRMKIDTDEISDLILGSKYPVKKGLPNKGISAIPDVITDEFRIEFKKLIVSHFNMVGDNSKLVDVLSYHDLFRLLQGNPTSLSRAANVYFNPFNNVTSLLDLYNQVKQNNISIED